eukprot:jgi/Hompol1/4593/HPOL_003749-RA
MLLQNHSGFGFETISSNPVLIEDILLKSDAVVLISSPERDLTGIVDQLVINKLVIKGKPNVFIAVPSAQQESQSIISKLEVKMATKLVHTKAADRLLDLKLPIFVPLATDTPDGLDATALKKSIAGLVSNRINAKNHTIEFLAWSALRHVTEQNAAAATLLAETRMNVADIAKHVVANEKRIVNEFRSADLGVVQAAIVDLSTAFRDYFAKTPFYKLFWRSDFISDDLVMRMREHSLIKAEYQATNEALCQLNAFVVDRLEPVTKSTHPFANHSTTAALQEDISRLLDIVRKNIDSSASRIDPFLLRNEVAAFDETKHCDSLQSTAHGLIQNQIILQFAVFLTALVATHLGVPFAISIPSGILFSGFALAWMNLRWMSAQRRFVNKISESQKTLVARLSSAYDHEFSRVVAAPLTTSIELITRAIEQRTAETLAANQQLQDLSRAIQSDTQKRHASAVSATNSK